MSLKVGSIDFSKAYVGSSEVDKIYLGSDIVYDASASASASAFFVNPFRYYRFIGTNNDNSFLSPPLNQAGRPSGTSPHVGIRRIELIDDNEESFPDYVNSANQESMFIANDLGRGLADPTTANARTGPYTNRTGTMSITAGFSHSNYPPYYAFSSNARYMWWSLGEPDGSVEHITVDFGPDDIPTKTIEQIKIILNPSWHTAEKIRIYASNDQNFSTYELWGELKTDGMTGVLGNDQILTVNRGKQLAVDTNGNTSESDLLVTSNLKIHIDAENADSYSGSGADITDLQGNHNATLAGTFNNTTPKNWEIVAETSTTEPTEFITFGDIETFDTPIDFTFSIWFEFTSFEGSTTDHDIFSKGSHGVNQSLLCWYDDVVSPLANEGSGNTHTISFMVTDNGAIDHWVAAESDSIQTGRIYNLVVQHDSDGKSRIFINNVKKADHEQPSTDGIRNNNSPLKIGAPSGGSLQDSNMKIYAFHAYDSFLTDAQIDQNWNNLKGRFGL